MAIIPFVPNENDQVQSTYKRADWRRAKRQAKKDAKHKQTDTYNNKCDQNHKQRLTRKQIRDLRKNKNLVRDLLSIINNYFPNLISSLKEIKDGRCKEYTTYDIDMVVLVRILSAIFSFNSQRAMTDGLNNDNAIKNIAAFLGKNDLDELPHGDTMNDCFKKMDPDDLERFIHEMINRLIRRNTFNDSRVICGEWQILVDATEFYRSSSRHCDHCLFSRHKSRVNGEVVHIDYYHHVLEAKLVINGSMVFSIQSEFIANEQPIPDEEELWSREYSEPGKDKVKQDCETKAFYRLAEKLKAAFPQLPICITTDALYPCKGMFEVCRRLGWHFIMRFKDGVIPALAKQFRTQVKKRPEQSVHDVGGDGAGLDYRFASDLEYEGFNINAVDLKDSRVKHPFWFITDYPMSKHSCKSIAEHGRRRWSIENQGFKRQKKHGYHLTHMFCKDYTAMKIHYLLIQVAHTISQLWEHSIDMKTLKYTIKGLHDEVSRLFRSQFLTPEDIVFAHMPKRVRLFHSKAA